MIPRPRQPHGRGSHWSDGRSSSWSLGFYPDAAACIRIYPCSGAKQLLRAIPHLLACDSTSCRKSVKPPASPDNTTCADAGRRNPKKLTARTAAKTVGRQTRCLTLPTRALPDCFEFFICVFVLPSRPLENRSFGSQLRDPKRLFPPSSIQDHHVAALLICRPYFVIVSVMVAYWVTLLSCSLQQPEAHTFQEPRSFG